MIIDKKNFFLFSIQFRQFFGVHWNVCLFHNLLNEKYKKKFFCCEIKNEVTFFSYEKKRFNFIYYKDSLWRATRNIIFYIHKYIFENPHIALARSFLLLRQSNKINKVENNPPDEIFFCDKKWQLKMSNEGWTQKCP